MSDCIFCKIRDGQIPSSKVYEDNHTFAFMDLNPVNKGHVLVVPKAHSENILDAKEEDLSRVLVSAKQVGKAIIKATKADGLNASINNNKAAGQVVFHLHMHLIPRFAGDGLTHWPHKNYDQGEMDDWAKEIRENL